MPALHSQVTRRWPDCALRAAREPRESDGDRVGCVWV